MQEETCIAANLGHSRKRHNAETGITMSALSFIKISLLEHTSCDLHQIQ